MEIKFKNRIIIIDDEDYSMVKNFTLAIDRKGYVLCSFKRGGKITTFTLHHLVTLFKNPMLDHEDGSGLNNKKINLRPCSFSQNNANRRKLTGANKYKGVERFKSGRYAVRLRVNKKKLSFGTYNTQEQAALVYNREAVRNFGEFAQLNIGNYIAK